LCQYYTSVQTKRRLNLDVPAGFRKTSQHQQNIAYCRQLNKMPQDTSEDQLLMEVCDSTIPIESSPHDLLPSNTSEQNTTLSSSTTRPPIIRSVDKP
jgi:hypothetical protein